MLPSTTGDVEEAGALSSRTASLSQGKGGENVEKEQRELSL